jgi:integrase/recombinase XerC/integrase/recombinase XerD
MGCLLKAPSFGRGFFTEWAGERPLVNPTRADILSYKGHLKSQNLSPFTISSYMTVVRKLFGWAEGEGRYPNIAKGIEGAKKPKGFSKDPLTVAQIKDMLDAVDRSDIQGKRDYAILNLLIRTGLRTIEVVRADVGDIRQDGGEAVLWIQGKARDSKDEFVLLTQDSLKPIRDYLNVRGDVTSDDPLFTSDSHRNAGERLTTRTIRRIVKEALSIIGIQDGRLSAHSLRHTAVTLSLMGGATIQEAQALGRHASIDTTMIYAHNLDRVANAPERKIDAFLRDEGV